MSIASEVSSKKARRGFALIFVLAFTAIIAVFTAATGAQAAYNMRLTANRGHTDRAYYAANTGTQLILSLMREPPSDRDFDGDGNVGTWLGEDCSVMLPMVSSNSDTFARVYHNIQGFGNAQPTAPDGTVIPPDCFYIVSIGVVNGEYDAAGNLNGGFRQDQATMGATVTPDFPIMPYAAFSFDMLDIQGEVDHFNSDDPVADWNNPGEKKYPEASVATNRLDAAAVSVTGATANINGNVLLGFGAPAAELTTLAANLPGTPKPLVANSGGLPPINTYAQTTSDSYGVDNDATPGPANPAVQVSGRVDAMPSPKTIPDMNVPASEIFYTYSAGGGTFDVTPGNDMNLAEGKTYLVDGNLAVNGGAIRVNDTNSDGEVDDVILLVKGDIDMNSGLVNDQLPPRRLKIYSQTGTTFDLAAGMNAYCLVAGKDLQATINDGATLWGAVLSDDVTVTPTGRIKFDVNLRDPNAVASIYGFHLGTTVVIPGASLSPGAMGPVGTGGTGGTSGTGTSGTGTSGTGTSGTTCGCGCGCGCGSMLMMAKY